MDYRVIDMDKESLEVILNREAKRINNKDFIDNDPVQFVHKYNNLEDIEVAGLIAAINAWGRRDMILRDVTNILAIMGTSPYSFIMDADLSKFTGNKSMHRTFKHADFAFICNGLRKAYSEVKSLEEYFIGKDMFDGIEQLRNTIISANSTDEYNSAKHIANPAKKSACKRLHLYLKWLVRNDGIVDLGVWKNISPASLYIPLDTHVAKVGRYLGLITRKQNDRQTVEELTLALKEFCPTDPILYDFALFGIGEQGIMEDVV